MIRVDGDVPATPRGATLDEGAPTMMTTTAISTVASQNLTPFAPTSSEAARYQAILQAKIDDGMGRAANVIERIHAEQPRDQIVPVRALSFIPGPDADVGVAMCFGGESLFPSDYALGQIAARANVPTAYLRELAHGADWQRELAAEIFTRHYRHHEAARVLARSVNGQLRGFLSDRYRRLDSRPIVDALATEAQAAGAVPIDGTMTETRLALKIVVPRVLEPIPGEFMVYGGELAHSDYGNGPLGFRQFFWRVVCLNGMTRENVLREIHLGGRLGDDITYSDRTYRLNTAASVSALRDVVRATLTPASIERMGETLRAAHAKKMTVAQLKAATKNVGKDSQKAIVDAFESEDVINLPAGETAWRASNAVSWIARHTKDAEKRLDLERVAGALT